MKTQIRTHRLNLLGRLARRFPARLIPLFLAGLTFAPATFAQVTPPDAPGLPALVPPPAQNVPNLDPSGLLATLPPPPPLPTGTAVVTDQADYAPGATAHIRGQEFAPGETVRLQVVHAEDPGDNISSASHQPWQITADANGSFQTTWNVPADEDEQGATLRLTATGLTSGKTAQALFTDAPAAPVYQQLKSFGKPSLGGYPYGGLIKGSDGALYGTAVNGGSSGLGVVFKLNPDGTGYTILKSFDNSTTGGNPYGKLMQGTDGALYGTTYSGGSGGAGTVFRLNPDGTGFTVLRNFDNSTTGGYLFAGLIQGTDGALYGTTREGGSTAYGTVFKLNPDGTGFTVLKGDFDYSTTGAYLYAGLMQGADGTLYGTAHNGGSSGYGTVYKLNPDGTGFTVLKYLDYSTTGGYHQGGELIQGTDGTLYGTAFNGGSSGAGTVFKLNPDGTGFTVLKNLSGSTDISEDGGYPYSGVIQGADGTLYGTTHQGGSSGHGTVFKMNSDGTGHTVLKNFDNATTGGYPYGGALIQGTDGALYGTTIQGGSSGYGTVFKLNPDGTGFVVLKNFDQSTTGGYLYSGLMQGTDGALYGTAFNGGSSSAGTLFKLNPDGTGFIVLKNFDYGTTGGYPQSSPLMQGTDGAIYGTASQGGSSGYGTVFKLNPDGTGFVVLKNFDYSTTGGYLWSGGLMQGADGALYGTAHNGGSSGYGTLFKLNPDGTGFSVLKNFDYYTTGGHLQGGGLVQRADGTIYGTALYGGSSGLGTVFQLNPDGSDFSVILNFDNGANGGYPFGKLAKGTDGNLYGTTVQGGNGAGTVFRLLFTAPNASPVARCKNVTVSAGANCTAAASVDDGSFDPDTGDTITVTQTPAGPYPLGDTLVTLTVTDSQGASSSCTATVTVQDTTAPVAPVLANVTGQCSATVTVPIATDNCAGTVVGTTSDPLVYNTQGTFIVHWTFSDGHGNSSAANQTVIVQDTIAPATPVLADVTGQCSATVTVPTTTDNCADTVTGTTSDPLVYNAQGTFTVHWTFDDGHGNSSAANQTVIVHDTENPTISVADMVVVSDRAACSAGDDDRKERSLDDNHGREGREGRHRDEGEDHSQCKDNHHDRDGGGHGYICKYWNRCRATGVVLTEPVVNDNCGIRSVVNDHPSTTFPLGVTLVTWTVTDIHDNVSTAVQTVTVLASVEVEFDAPVVRKPTKNTIRRGQVVPFKVDLENCLGSTVKTGVTVSLNVQGIELLNGEETVFQDVVEDASGVGADGTLTADGLMILKGDDWKFNLDTSNFGDPNTISGTRFYRATVVVTDNATLAVVGAGTLNMETGKK